jgi:hypothetical protein
MHYPQNCPAFWQASERQRECADERDQKRELANELAYIPRKVQRSEITGPARTLGTGD